MKSILNLVIIFSALAVSAAQAQHVSCKDSAEMIAQKKYMELYGAVGNHVNTLIVASNGKTERTYLVSFYEGGNSYRNFYVPIKVNKYIGYDAEYCRPNGDMRVKEISGDGEEYDREFDVATTGSYSP